MLNVCVYLYLVVPLTGTFQGPFLGRCLYKITLFRKLRCFVCSVDTDFFMLFGLILGLDPGNGLNDLLCVPSNLRYSAIL